MAKAVLLALAILLAATGCECFHSDLIPGWFVGFTQLCYKWSPSGNGGQCGGGVSRELCANINQYTPFYLDESDNRAGGCRMQWSIQYVTY